MSLKGTTHKDAFLTNIAQTYPTGTLVGKEVAPIKVVSSYADTVFADADDAINLNNTVAENTPSNGVNFEVGTGYSYRTKRHALNAVLLEKTMRQEDSIVNSRIRETKKLTHRLLLDHEYQVAAVLSDVAKVTQYATMSGTDQWDNASYASTFEKKLITAVKTIKANSGQSPNTIVVPFTAALYMASFSTITGKLQYQYGMEIIKSDFQAQAKALIGLPPYIYGLRLVVADGRYNNANEGETASKGEVWGKNCYIGYVPPMGSIEDTYGILTMEFDPFMVSETPLIDPKGRKILVEWDYDLLEADLTTWYLMKDVIS